MKIKKPKRPKNQLFSFFSFFKKMKNSRFLKMGLDSHNSERLCHGIRGHVPLYTNADAFQEMASVSVIVQNEDVYSHPYL